MSDREKPKNIYLNSPGDIANNLPKYGKYSFGEEYIRPENRLDNSGVLQTILNMLDYPANAVRSSIVGAEHGKGSKYALQALGGKRYTPESQVKDLATEKSGIGKVRFGKDDGKFQAGDLADIALDLGVGIILDPLTYMSLGTSKIAKEGLRNTLKVKSLETATGGMIGAGAAPSNASPKERIAFGLLGAALGNQSDKVKAILGSTTQKVGDKIVDTYAVRTRGKDFRDFSKKYREASKAFDKIDSVAKKVFTQNIETTLHLSDSEKKVFKETLHLLKNKTAKIRENMAGKIKMKYGVREINPIVQRSIDSLANKETDKFFKKIEGELSPKVSKSIQAHTRNNIDTISQLNESSSRHLLPNDLKELKIDDLGQFNSLDQTFKGYKRDFLRNNLKNKKSREAYEKVLPLADEYAYNKLLKNIESQKETVIDLAKEWDTWKKSGKKLEVVGLKYHIRSDPITKIDDLKDNVKINTKLKRFRSSEKAIPDTDIKFNNFTSDEILDGLYAEKISKKFLKDSESEAIDLINKYESHTFKPYVPKGANKASKMYALGYSLADIANISKDTAAWHLANNKAYAYEKSLDILIDRPTSFAKKHMLLFSSTWLINSYYENALKSYVEHGLISFVDTVTLKSNGKKIAKDVDAILANRRPQIVDDGGVVKAFKFGVLDSNLFRELKESTKLPDGQLLKKEAESLESNQAIMAVEDGYRKWSSFLDKTTGRIGSIFEGTARVAYFNRTYDLLSKSKLYSDEQAGRISAKMTNNVFFDYRPRQDAFREKVTKRLIPFWDFYANNSRYWLEKVKNPRSASRIANIGRIHRSIGSEPNNNEPIPQYFKDKNPRKLDEDKYLLLSNIPFDEAVITSKSGVLNKLNPLVKAVPELLLNYDSFTDSKLFPTESGEKKYLFSSGYKFYYLQNLVQKALVKSTGIKKEELFGVKLEKEKHPILTSKKAAIINKVFNTLVPTPALDQVAGSLGKIQSGREKVGETLLDRLTPYHSVTISKGQKKYLRKENGGQK